MPSASQILYSSLREDLAESNSRFNALSCDCHSLSLFLWPLQESLNRQPMNLSPSYIAHDHQKRRGLKSYCGRLGPLQIAESYR